MKIDREEIDAILQSIDKDLENGDIDSAQEKIQDVRDTIDPAHGDGEVTIGINVDVWSYEYNDDIYYVTADYSSIPEAVEALVAKHVSALAWDGNSEAYAAKMRDDDAAVTKSQYDSVDVDEEISIHTDIYYMRCSVHYEGTESGNINRPSKDDVMDGVQRVIELADSDEPNGFQETGEPIDYHSEE